jgi:hypothetical protein
MPETVGLDFKYYAPPSQHKTGWDLEVQSVHDTLCVKPHQTIDEICDRTQLSREAVLDVLRYFAKSQILGRRGNRFYLAEE